MIPMSKNIGFVETPRDICKLMIELSNLPKDASVLDVGSGKGAFLEELQNLGFRNCTGIEIDKEFYENLLYKFKNYKIINGNFLTYNFCDKFDLIIGNPPYMHLNQIPEDLAKNVQDLIKTNQGDIYYAFIQRSIEWLKEGGEMILIVPYHFFYNTYAKFLRNEILKNGKFEIIIDLDEVNLFNNEHPETIIFKFRKGNFNLNNESIELLKIKQKNTLPENIYIQAFESLRTHNSNNLFDYGIMKHYTNNNPWSTYIFNIPDFPFRKLNEIARVGVGFVSGYDLAFKLSEKEIENFNKNERMLVRKFVKGKNCKRYIVKGYKNYILINDTFKDEKILQENYPNIYKRIEQYKVEMSSRFLAKKKQWFQWQALRNYKYLMENNDKLKIYVPTLDRHSFNRFSIGEEGLLPSGDVLFIQPYDDEDIYFLLGYLNSDFFRQYYLSIGARRGGRITFTQKLLDDAQIPQFPDKMKKEISQIVKNIIDNLESNKEIKILEQDLNEKINNGIIKINTI